MANRKIFTPEERFEFHSRRALDMSLPENQRRYSLNWLEGYVSDKSEAHELLKTFSKDLDPKSCNVVYESKERAASCTGFAYGLYSRVKSLRGTATPYEKDRYSQILRKSHKRGHV